MMPSDSASQHWLRHPKRRSLALVMALCGGVGVCGPLARAVEPEFMVKAEVAGEFLEGKPLAWSDQRVFLLSRDGRLVDFSPAEARDYRQSAPRFFSYSTAEMRSQLYEEFGHDIDISGTGHYLVVHPRGQKDQWAQRFEDLYRSFCHYFRVRGLKLAEPKYPLVAVVFRNREQYEQYAEQTGSTLGPNMLGHYSPRTNRIALFDITGGDASQDWATNATTIIHEATHQTAFNAGVHSRFTEVPRWVSEGLATMFEAPGVWSFASHSSRRDRVSREQLAAFREYAAQRREAGAMQDLIVSDQLFRRDVYGAYAEAWALSFYLSETRSHDYGRYLQRTADREQFREYPPEERLQDFQQSFGDDLKMLEVQYLRWIKELK
ncbi:MAG: DUF1570 domain-containing protein [Pirellulales bacterium]